MRQKWAYTCIDNCKLIFYYGLNTVIHNYFVELFYSVLYNSCTLREKLGYSESKTISGKCPYLRIMYMAQHRNKNTVDLSETDRQGKQMVWKQTYTNTELNIWQWWRFRIGGNILHTNRFGTISHLGRKKIQIFPSFDPKTKN